MHSQAFLRTMINKLDRPRKAGAQVTGIEYALIATSVAVAVISALLTIGDLPL